MELTRKGESRCYVFKEDHIEKVIEIIKELDDFEFRYMPTNWITVFNKKDLYRNSMVYNGKFDINVPDLIEKCGENGIGVIIRSSNIPDDLF